MTPEQLEAYRRRRREDKRRREAIAKDMGLEYWLEMVDAKHRYGSHLRKYHAIWCTADTHENFFYWLDEGDGRLVDAPKCSRHVLDRDKVRYLSREERLKYLVKIDKDGRLRYAKNGELINTTAFFKDSIEGIVPIDDNTPAFREDVRFGVRKPVAAVVPSDSSSTNSEESASDDGTHYGHDNLGTANGIHKIEHVSADVVLTHLLKSTTKKNIWIFVADTSFRLYVGIKQPGAFQHSSFLHGARISSAGQLKVKNGQLRMLAPLSGHYRPPITAFRAFVRSLRDHGADMSRVSISRSYAVLLGLEAYKKSRKKADDGIKSLGTKFEKVLMPEKARKKEQDALDHSESARREREWLERQRLEKREQGLRASLGRGLGLTRSRSSTSDQAASGEQGKV